MLMQADTILSNATSNFACAADMLTGEFDRDLIEKIAQPKERIEITVGPQFDDSRIHTFKAFVVRHNDALGPAKGGIRMLTRNMAAEWGELGIRANAIGPGYMATEMNTALIENEEFNDWVKRRTPMRRWGQPEELVGTAIYLASDASSYVAGQIIYVDGGMSVVL